MADCSLGLYLGTGAYGTRATPAVLTVSLAGARRVGERLLATGAAHLVVLKEPDPSGGQPQRKITVRESDRGKTEVLTDLSLHVMGRQATCRCSARMADFEAGAAWRTTVRQRRA